MTLIKPKFTVQELEEIDKDAYMVVNQMIFDVAVKLYKKIPHESTKMGLEKFMEIITNMLNEGTVRLIMSEDGFDMAVFDETIGQYQIRRF